MNEISSFLVGCFAGFVLGLILIAKLVSVDADRTIEQVQKEAIRLELGTYDDTGKFVFKAAMDSGS